MSKAAFWSIYTPFALVALWVGWVIGTPHQAVTTAAMTSAPSKMAATSTSAASAQTRPTLAAQTANPESGDTSSPQALRAGLATALDRVEAAPCDPEARAAFLSAYADRAGAIADAANAGTGDRPEVWKTDDDMTADQRVDQLQKQHWFTQDEIGLAVVRRRMGDSFMTAQAQPSPQAARMNSPARCSALATASSGRS